MPQGRLQIRSSLVAVTSLVRSLTHFARSTAHSRSAFTHAYELALDLEWEVLADKLGIAGTAYFQRRFNFRRDAAQSRR